MAFKDLFIAPFVLLFVFMIAAALRPLFTDATTKPYFFKGLGIKIMGGLLFGAVYQFYYGGGDTFEYYKQGAIIYDSFFDSPGIWLKLVLAQGKFDPDTLDYALRMYWFSAPAEYNVIRVSGFLALFCFNSFTAITILFSSIGYIGIWAMYNTFYKIEPRLHKEFAYACFFIPSYFFWGSGIMKDTITIGGLGLLFYGVHQILFLRKGLIKNTLFIVVAGMAIVGVKVYVLLGFIPALTIWLSTTYSGKIKSKALRTLLFPMALAIFAGAGYVAINQLASFNQKYSLDRLAGTAITTAWWLSYVSEVQDGSGYSLGELDPTPTGMLKKAPAAIVVSLFRPYLWEARKPIMLLTSLESTFFLILTLRSFWRAGVRKALSLLFSDPFVLFCVIFTLIMAFTVGISSYNFGSLARYKIPFLPFYVASIYILQFKVDESRQEGALEKA